MCPHFDPRGTPPEQQTQGACALHCKDGWSALAFWDRSADPRWRSNSAFVAKGTHSFDQMLVLARQTFPELTVRFGDTLRMEDAPQMKALASSPWNYTLYDRDGALVLYVIVGTTALYEVQVVLTPDQVAAYQTDGAPFLEALAAKTRA